MIIISNCLCNMLKTQWNPGWKTMISKERSEEKEISGFLIIFMVILDCWVLQLYKVRFLGKAAFER